MEQTLNNQRTLTQTIVKEGAIVITFAVLYFAMVNMNPWAGLTGMANLAILSNIRIANILKAFVIVSPSAVGGIAMGAYAFNMYSGKVAFGAYSAMPFITMCIGALAFFVSAKIGRSTIKDLSVLAVYGLITGLVVSLNLVAISTLVSNETWSMIFTTAVQLKIAFHIITPMIGYPLVKKLGGVFNAQSGFIK